MGEAAQAEPDVGPEVPGEEPDGAVTAPLTDVHLLMA